MKSKISDVYHHPDGFYALDVLINLIQKQTGLGVERVHSEGLDIPEGRLYLIASGAHSRCIVRDEDGRWVIRYNRTCPAVSIPQRPKRLLPPISPCVPAFLLLHPIAP